MAEQSKIILTIAGSDPSGGAGIQADLKSFARIGVYGAAAITCLTVQNTQGVFATNPVDPSIVKQQIEAVLNDMPVSHIKTGMFGNGEISAAAGEALAGYAGEVICDPVLKSSSGHDLLDSRAQSAFIEHIIKRATVLTPNIPELEILAEQNCTKEEDIVQACHHLFRRLNKLRCIIVTGGHYQEKNNTVTDNLLQRPNELDDEPLITAKTHKRINSRNTHGTGCTFTSSFAAYHLLTGNDQEAFHNSVLFVDSLLQKSIAHHLGNGTGPLLHHLI